MRFRQHYWQIGLLMALLLWGCGSKESNPAGASSNFPTAAMEERKVEVIEVVPRSISYTVSAVGSLKTLEDVTISPKRAGIIEKIFVKEGDRVKKGQILVQLNDVDARLQVEMSEARVKEAEASLETDRTTLARYQKLFETKVIPQQTYDDLILKVKLDEARLNLARAELNLARQNLSDHQIVSPIDGVINVKIAALGEHVNVAPKDEILKIVQMDPLELEFYVPENLATMVRLGTRLEFTVKAFSGERFSATLRFISPTADPSTRNVRMKALVQNPHHRLKPGFFTEVSIRTGANSNALLIPEASLLSEKGKSFVFVVQDGVAHRTGVETGVRMEGQVELVKGIQKGQQVVTAGYEQLSEGMKVRISTKQ